MSGSLLKVPLIWFLLGFGLAWCLVLNYETAHPIIVNRYRIQTNGTDYRIIFWDKLGGRFNTNYIWDGHADKKVWHDL